MDKAVPKNRFLALDALRGIAAIGIFIFHIHSANFLIFNGFWLLVDFFFILSGFVLYPQISELARLSNGISFIRKRIIRILPLSSLTIVFMIFRQHSDELQSLKRLEVSSTPSYIGAILLLQVFSYQIVQVNLTLWSLSTEFFVNIMSVFFHSSKMILVVMVCSFFIMSFSIYNGYPKEIGLFALSRTLLGFYSGMVLRKFENQIQLSKLRLAMCAVLLVPIFHLGGKYALAILVAIPIFGAITLDASKIHYHEHSRYFTCISVWLGRNSYGIYVWQVPVNSVVQSRYIANIFTLEVSNISTQIFVVICKLSVLLMVSELSIRYFEKPVQQKLNELLTKVKKSDL